MAYLVSEQSGVQKINGAAYPGIWVEKQVVFVKMVFNTDISSLPAASLFELGTTTPVSAGTVADSSFGVVESVLVQALEQLETDATILAISNFAQITPTGPVATTTTTAAAAGTVIPVTATTGFVAGQTIAVTVGPGSFAPGTKIVSVQVGVSVTVSAPPTFPLALGATVTGSTFAGSQVDVMLGYATSFFGLVTLVGGLPTATGAIANANTATPLVALTSPPVDSYTQALIFAPGSAAADAAGTLVTVNPAAGISWTFEFAYMDGLMDVATSANGALQYITDGVGQGTAQNPMGQPGYYPYDPYTA
jgi:hypothetical protein